MPVFAFPWDLTGALRVRWRRDQIIAIPSYPQTRYACRGSRLAVAGAPLDVGIGGGFIAPRYRNPLYFYADETGVFIRIRNQADCRRALRQVADYMTIPTS